MSSPKYGCGCGRALQSDYVESVQRGGWMNGAASVIVSYRCECNPDAELHRRYYYYRGTVVGLTGGEGLPYRNPHPLVPVREDHPDMKAWRYLLGQYCGNSAAFIAELQSS